MGGFAALALAPAVYADTVVFTNTLDSASNDAFLDNIRIIKFDNVISGTSGADTLPVNRSTEYSVEVTSPLSTAM